MQEPTKPSDPVECGKHDFAMDVLENAPFASVRMPGKGYHVPPWYIRPSEEKAYMKAYFEAADAHYGVEHVMKERAELAAKYPPQHIEGTRERTPLEQLDAMLRQVEAFSENHAKYVYGNKLHIAFRPDPQTSGFKGSIFGTPLAAPSLWDLVHMMREDIRKTVAKKRMDVLERHREVMANLDAADDAIRDDQRYEYPNGDVAVDLEEAREQRVQRELADASQRIEAAHAKMLPTRDMIDASWKKKLDDVYEERNLVVLLLARLAGRLGWTVGTKQHDPADKDWDDEWRTILFIESPAGQLSWHLHESEKRHVEYVPAYEKEWDRHTTEEKYARVRALLDQRTNLGEVTEGSTFFRTTKEFEYRAIEAERKQRVAEAELQKFIDEPKRGQVLELNAYLDADRRKLRALEKQLEEAKHFEPRLEIANSTIADNEETIASLKDVNKRLSDELREINEMRREANPSNPDVKLVADPEMPKDKAVMISPGHMSNPSITIHGIGTDKSG